MKKVVISSVLMALLVLSGCGDKEPQVEATDSATQEVQQVETESVSSVEAPVVTESATESTSQVITRLESELKTIYFDFDKFNIRADMQANLSAGASVVNTQAKNFFVKLEGNCDEWGSDEYNFALGLKRAETVKKALAAEGVDASRISMVSFGESNPVCTDKTKECWSKNRRVEFKLLP
ncbi:OmpA family protein [Sulfurimonas sp.]|uniref:OmpA family protein n=1 Tax=Sulfurimonas sp. TaxID=2022749 RepID=UPI0025D394CC|nr:OmpA family protein [Sulfurimonas sp.]MBW6488181.1 OmpA family protein [Sulfurimonas sp.]